MRRRTQAEKEFMFLNAYKAEDYTQCVRLLLGMFLWLPVKKQNGNLIVTHRGDRKLVRSYTSPERVDAIAGPDVDPAAAVQMRFADLVESWRSTEYGPVINPDSDSEFHLPPQVFPKVRRMAHRFRIELFGLARTREPKLLPVNRMGEFRFAALVDGLDAEGCPAILPERRMISDPEEKEKIRGYLQSGAVLQALAGRAPDLFDPDRGNVVPANTLTDGTWIWQDGMVYYLDKYDLGPEPEFLEHMAAAGFQCPEVPPSRLELAGRALLEWQRLTAERYRVTDRASGQAPLAGRGERLLGT